MRNENSRDPWLDRSRTSTMGWDTALRPSPSSDRWWAVLAVAAAALVAFVAFNVGRDSAPSQRAATRPPTSAASPERAASPVPREDERQPSTGPSPRIQRFSKCLSVNGAASYSDGPCPAGTRAGAVLVKPDANLADGMSDRARQASMQRNSAIAQTIVEHERRVAMNVDSASSECAQLDAEIASIDAATRRPLSGAEQDWFKDQRRRARDRQFALHCR